MDFEKEALRLWPVLRINYQDVGPNESLFALESALRRAYEAGKREAFEEAARGAGCECSSATPVECALCSYGDYLRYKALGLSASREEGK